MTWMPRTSRSVVALTAAALAIIFTAVIPGTALAADPSHDKMMMLPVTASDHLARAKVYDEKAAMWRQEATEHREMATAYKKARPANDPDAATMEKHCMKIVKDADVLAADALETAAYHRLRAKELQAK